MMETQTCPGARHVLAKVFGEDGIKERVKLQQLRSKVLSERKDYVSWRRNFLVHIPRHVTSRVPLKLHIISRLVRDRIEDIYYI